MRKLVLTLVLLAGAVIAAWLVLRTPRAESRSAIDAARVAEHLSTGVEESLETIDAFEADTADERELVVVEDDDVAALTVDGSLVRKLKRDERWARIRVLDRATDKPVELFGARASPRTSTGHSVEGVLSSRILFERHPAGYADIAASPKATVLQVEAPGYMQLESELLAEAFNGGAQTVELARGGALSGRVTIDKHLARSVRVRLRRTPIVGHEAARGVDQPFDLTRFAGRSRVLRTKLDGRFAFHGLALGTYELDLRGPDGARARIDAIRLAEPTHIGVGDIALNSGAELCGRALLPHGARPEGVRLFVQTTGRSDATKLDQQASFEVCGLPPGPCSLTVVELEGALIAGPPFEFELAAGETREVVLDLRDRAGMWIEARVLSNGQPVRGVQVHFPRGNSFKASSHTVSIDKVRTDETGSERSWQPPQERIALNVSSNEGMSLGRYESEVVVLSSGDGMVELDLQLAELHVDWRGITPMPESDSLRITFQSLDDSSIRGFKNVNRVVFERRELEWGVVLTGRATVSLEFTAYESSDGLIAQFQRTLELEPGERAVCSFNDADRVE